MILKNIEAICKKKNISISKLERDSGLGNGTVKGWETSSPRVDSLKRVAEYLEVSIEELLK